VIAIPGESLTTRSIRCSIAVLMSLIIAGGALWLFTRNNDFPSDYYHPDEPGKIEQLQGAAPWNFHHPVLLLQTASWSRSLHRVSIQDQQTLAIVGRSASAFLAAGGVFAAAMTGYLAFGFAGLFLCGVAIALCPPLLIHAHYFKEDASLIGGILLAMLAAVMTVRSSTPNARRLALVALGIGCAAAASGKLIGIFTLIPALLAIRSAPRLAIPATTRPRRMILLSGLAAFALINHQALLHLPRAIGGFTEEIGHGVGGHQGLRLGFMNGFAMHVSARETMPHVYITLGAALVLLMMMHRRIAPVALVIGSFLLTFIAVLALNQIPIPRYGLPITVLTWFCAAAALSGVIVSLRRVKLLPPVLTVAYLAGLVALQWPRCARMNELFGDDPRQRMYEFVATQTPPDAQIVSEAFTALHGGGDPWRHPDQPRRTQQIGYAMTAAAAGDLDSLARRGVDYIAIADANFERFLDPYVHPTASFGPQYRQYRAFYEKLFTQGELVWSNTPAHPTNAYVDQDLRLYRIRSPR
jgi:hypothetical protein